ncbi:hypothetical protein ABN16_07340 [Levilactobacillus koreensis]|uniref:Uncharacterized protein n=1 Tax=Levilactobacillus koreensis TaxID=637971 RepID=A0AAC8ZGI7_9LACO|nr:hypothetical protein ABN16_07340 [Levilactobacillus koreensis]
MRLQVALGAAPQAPGLPHRMEFLPAEDDNCQSNVKRKILEYGKVENVAVETRRREEQRDATNF